MCDAIASPSFASLFVFLSVCPFVCLSVCLFTRMMMMCEHMSSSGGKCNFQGNLPSPPSPSTGLHMCTRMYTYVHVCTRMYTYMYMCTCTCVHVCTRVCVQTHTQYFTLLCPLVCRCLQYVYTYVCAYTHTVFYFPISLSFTFMLYQYKIQKVKF